MKDKKMLVFSLALATIGLVLVLAACRQPAQEKIIYPQTKKGRGGR